MISETKLHTLSIRFECRMLRVISLMLAQFERLLLETDITVGVARRVLEKRHDLKNRAFNDLKKDLESKCVEAVGMAYTRVYLSRQRQRFGCRSRTLCSAGT